MRHLILYKFYINSSVPSFNAYIASFTLSHKMFHRARKIPVVEKEKKKKKGTDSANEDSKVKWETSKS